VAWGTAATKRRLLPPRELRQPSARTPRL
jgi:hypothetical protein